MPRFDRLTDAQIGAIAAFLKSRVDYSATKGQLRDEAILEGDAVAGQVFFNAAGGCAACHSGTGDLRGIGSKYSAVGLQERLVMPHRDTLRSKRRATVSLATGETVSGVLLRLTDFDVSIRDESGWTRSFLRQQGVPKVSVVDPLQAHVDRLPKWRDAEIHDVTAYLAGLK
jgi:hypothetical protein